MERTEKVKMKSMAEICNQLLAEGFNAQFRAMENGLESLSTNKIFQPTEIKIVNFYRFEGESDPADNAILYAIEAHDGEKGTLSDSYGAYGDIHVTKFIQEVEEIHKDYRTKMQQNETEKRLEDNESIQENTIVIDQKIKNI